MDEGHKNCTSRTFCITYRRNVDGQNEVIFVFGNTEDGKQSRAANEDITTLPKILNGHATGGGGASAPKRSAQLEKEIDRIWEENQKHTLAAAEKIYQRSQLRVKSALEKEVQRLQKENVSLNLYCFPIF